MYVFVKKIIFIFYQCMEKCQTIVNSNEIQSTYCDSLGRMYSVGFSFGWNPFGAIKQNKKSNLYF